MATAAWRLCAMAAALLLGATPAPAYDELRFAPARGTVLEKTLRYDHELAVVQVSRTAAGVPSKDPELGGWVRGQQIYALADRYEDVEPGRVRSLLREFRACTGKASVTLKGLGRDGRHSGVDLFSPLRGQVVRFTWIEPEGEHARMYETFDAPETYLARLDADMDLLSALPAGPVETGDSWELDAQKQCSLLAPGGDLLIWPSRVGNPFARNVCIGMAGNVGELVAGEATGDGRATYQGVREVDGVELSVIALDLQLRVDCDKTARYAKYMPEREEQTTDLLESVLLHFEYTGQGEVLWDNAAGHARSMTLEGQQRLIVSIGKRVNTRPDLPEGEPLVEDIELEGSLVLAVNVAN
jgi:hypothetical protein